MEPLVILGFLLGFTHFTAAYEVTLLDTTRENELGWTTYRGGGGREWVETSWNTDSGESLRAYHSCNVDAQGVNNWLRMPYLARGNANRLYIEIKFTMRKCNLYPDPDQLLQCKESFKLLYYEAESDFANDMMPTWDAYTYKDIDVIAADNSFVSLDQTIVNTEIREIPITKDGVYFAFYDTGACTMLLSVRVYYIMCLSITANFAIFPNTTTGAESSSFEQQTGTCVPHAAIEEKPTYICSAKGAWSYVDGGCKCMPGYEPDATNTQCSACRVGMYKWQTGSDECKPCPQHSEAPSEASVECGCMSGYYRNSNDEKSRSCTRPPTEVQNLVVESHDQSVVNLTWEHPADTGGRKDFYYGVDCIACGAYVTFYPKKQHFNTTKVSVIGLNPDTKYKLIVYAENGVSEQSGVASTSSVVVTTQPAIPSQVVNLHFASAGLEYIGIAWDPPAEPNSRIEKYEVRFYVRTQEENASSVYTRFPNATFRQLQQETEYCFKVRGKTQQGWGEFSHHICTKTGHLAAQGINKVDTQSDSPVGIIAGSAVAVVVCMIIVIIMVIIFLRRYIKAYIRLRNVSGYRNHRSCSEKNVSDCDTLQYSNVQCPHVLEHGHVMNGGLTMPLFMPPGGIRTYIDPHTYEDPNQAVREFTKEIDAACITIESVIGGGEFGDVCKGRLRLPGKGELSVAIKTLKAGASDKNRLDFLTEASIMGQFDDPNVIYLEGVVTKSNPIMIVTEYMENGSLDTFLRTNDGKFTVIQLVGMMRGIAAGMRYLSDMGYVHRDLAARNILANESLVCKVADFGLSREIESDDTDGAYTTKGGKIPVRWTAPEAIAYRKFTSASDVWSNGVVMWEVMSYAERPYWNWSNQDVIKAIEKGFRLPPPMDCPESIHQLMLDCWQKERSHRPKFTAIVKTLDKLIRAPELLRKIAKPRPYQFLDPSTPDYTRFDSIEEWLSSIKMERYIDHFLNAGYSGMDQVAQITLKDLTNLGVMLVGHQKKIMNSVQTMRAQLAGAQVSEGLIV